MWGLYVPVSRGSHGSAERQRKRKDSHCFQGRLSPVRLGARRKRSRVTFLWNISHRRSVWSGCGCQCEWQDLSGDRRDLRLFVESCPLLSTLCPRNYISLSLHKPTRISVSRNCDQSRSSM